MKKLVFLLITVVFATITLNVSPVKAQQHKTAHKKVMHKKMMECYTMKDGKMYHMSGDKEMLLEKEITLKNGDIVMPDGIVKMKDGKEMQLKNEECIDVKGVFHKSHMEHPKKM